MAIRNVMKPYVKKNKIALDAGLSPDLSDLKPDKLQVSAPAVDRLVAKSLGGNLRAIFSDVLDEPVPQRFIDLLDGLEDGGSSRERNPVTFS